MAEPFRVRSALRAATADLHERVDSAFSQADLADRAGYGQFLLAQAAAHNCIEGAIDDGRAEAILGDWPSRRRAHLLAADLAALGLAPPRAAAAPVLNEVPALLGAVYVLEGSRLGGEMIRRSVPASYPTAFLGGGNSAAWRGLLGVLDQHIRSADEMQIAINAAREAFMLFERSAHQFLKAEPV